jgi:glucokinase
MERFAVSIDLGGTNLKGGIVSAEGTITGYRSVPSHVADGPVLIMENLISFTRDLLHDSKQSSLPVEGIGVATPGIIDPAFGGLTGGADNLPGWKNTPFMKILTQKFSIPVFAHNDVTATVLGEVRYGAGIGRADVVMASFGTGIGGGIMINGKLYDGATGYAGEIGHLVIAARGHTCTCGMRGCWEEYAATRGILRIARHHMKRDRIEKSILFGEMQRSQQGLTPRNIFQTAREGDHLALAIVDEIGRNTAVGLGSLINIFDPEMVIVGGGIAEAGAIYLNAIKSHIQDWTLPDSLRGVQIVLAKLGSRAGIFGASTLVFDKINRYKE